MKNKRVSLFFGLLMIIFGLIFLSQQLRPDIFSFLFGGMNSWPWVVIGVGVLFILSAGVMNVGGLFFPGSIISTIGVILLIQNMTGAWESWTYAWALIPASIGLALVLSGIMRKRIRTIRTGFILSGINLCIFFALWGLFEKETPGWVDYWPVLLMGLGIIILVNALIPNRN